MFKKGKFAFKSGGFDIANTEDFTVEVWFRLDFELPNEKGVVTTLFGKHDGTVSFYSGSSKEIRLGSLLCSKLANRLELY